MFFDLSLAWDKENIPSPNEELHLRPLDSVLWCPANQQQRNQTSDPQILAPILCHWATETLWWARPITKFIMHVLHTARIMGTQNIFFVQHLLQDKKHLSLLLYHASSKFFLIPFTNMVLSGWSSQYTGCMSYMNFVMGLAHHRVLVAQW